VKREQAMAPVLAGTPGMVPGEEPSQERVILHLDVDSFYCAVEVRDAPALRGLPIAVQQFNSGRYSLFSKP